jgi:hypothetical protein
MKRTPNSDVAQRCVKLRKAMGYDYHGGQSEFADFLGVTIGRWNGVEHGNPLSKSLAFRVVQKCPEVTVDWLWFGNSGGLSVRMARALGELPGGSPP